MRNLNDIPLAEREEIIATIQAEAQALNWHTLNHGAKSILYDGWAERFDLKRTAIKDRIMKGFDAAQPIPLSGEAAVHARVMDILSASSVPFWQSKVKLWDGRAQADFVFGFNRQLLTHTAELEAARPGGTA